MVGFELHGGFKCYRFPAYLRVYPAITTISSISDFIRRLIKFKAQVNYVFMIGYRKYTCHLKVDINTCFVTFFYQCAVQLFSEVKLALRCDIKNVCSVFSWLLSPV